MKGYEDYVQPPSYKDSQVPDEGPLIVKLRLRIQQDLNQINGAYDSQISESEDKKRHRLLEIDLEYKKMIESINKQRLNEIENYTKEAERHIDNLIAHMNNSPQKVVKNWWNKIFGI